MSTEFLTTTEAGAILGVTGSEVRRLLDTKKLEGIKRGRGRGGVWEISAESVERRRVKMMKITPEIKAFMDEQLAKGIGIVESGEEDGKGWDRFEFEHEGKIYKGRYYWESEDFIELEIEEK